MQEPISTAGKNLLPRAQREQQIKEVIMEPGGSRQCQIYPLQHGIQVPEPEYFTELAKGSAENAHRWGLEDKEEP